MCNFVILTKVSICFNVTTYTETGGGLDDAEAVILGNMVI